MSSSGIIVQSKEQILKTLQQNYRVWQYSNIQNYQFDYQNLCEPTHNCLTGYNQLVTITVINNIATHVKLSISDIEEKLLKNSK